MASGFDSHALHLTFANPYPNTRASITLTLSPSYLVWNKLVSESYRGLIPKNPSASSYCYISTHYSRSVRANSWISTSSLAQNSSSYTYRIRITFYDIKCHGKTLIAPNHKYSISEWYLSRKQEDFVEDHKWFSSVSALFYFISKTPEHRWELPILRYNRIRVNHPHQFLGIILPWNSPIVAFPLFIVEYFFL